MSLSCVHCEEEYSEQHIRQYPKTRDQHQRSRQTRLHRKSKSVQNKSTEHERQHQQGQSDAGRYHPAWRHSGRRNEEQREQDAEDSETYQTLGNVLLTESSQICDIVRARQEEESHHYQRNGAGPERESKLRACRRIPACRWRAGVSVSVHIHPLYRAYCEYSLTPIY